MRSSTYDEAALSERTYHEQFQRYNSDDFNVEDRYDGGKENIFKDFELAALLTGDLCQKQEETFIMSLGA